MRRGLAFAICLLAVSACRVTDMRLWGPVGKPDADACAVAYIRDITYYDGPQAHPLKHRLDLYIPQGKKDYPVAVVVHGGAWILGDNRCCGLYSSVGEALARQGIGAVLPNYRLSPGVKHPEHAKDVARAVAWTKNNIAKQGGDPRRLYLVGHSAGGHLVALLATDESYLRAEGCTIDDIKGVVGVSGVYRIPNGNAEVLLGGSSELALRLDEMFPMRGNGMRHGPEHLPGRPISINIFGPAFGDDPHTRLAASPVHHIRPGLPPFLLFNPQKELPLLPGMAEEMHETLRKHGCASVHATIENRNHNSLFFKAAEPGDPIGRAIVEFIRR